MESWVNLRRLGKIAPRSENKVNFIFITRFAFSLGFSIYQTSLMTKPKVLETNIKDVLTKLTCTTKL